MKTLQNLVVLTLLTLFLGLCLDGWLHNIYIVASSDVTVATIGRAIGIVIFPIGIILGLI